MNSFIEAANKAEQQTVIDRETKELVKVYSQADLDKQKSISVQLRRDLFSHDSPRNAEELYKYLDVVYGLKLATTVSDPKWNSPFEWAHAMYFDKYSTLLAVAPRGSGKTYGASVITYDKCAHRQNYSAVHVGSRLDQADVAQQYLTNFAIDPVLNGGLDRKGIGKKRARWDSTDATWKIVSGTTAGVSGQHPQMLSIDEIEFADEQMIEQSWPVPVERDGWPRLWTGFSTRQRASSMMSKLTQDAENGTKKIKLMQWSIFEVMQPCETCLGYESPVLLADGSTRKIGTIVNKKMPLIVKSFDMESGQLVDKKITGWIKKSSEDVEWFRVARKRARSRHKGSKQNPYGMWITGDHNVYAERGTVRVDELLDTDKLLADTRQANTVQQQIIDGTMLGDAHLCKPKSKKANSRYTFTQTETRKEYVDFIAQALENISGGSVADNPERGHTKPSRSFHSHTSDYWWDQRERWYTDDGEKIVPNDVELTPLVLACWYMDDGNIALTHDKFRRITFCTQGFSNESVWRLFYKLVDLGYKPRVSVASNKNLEIHLGESNGDVDRFLQTVAPYIVPCCRYKIIGDYLAFDPSLWNAGLSVPFYTAVDIIRGERPNKRTNCLFSYVYCLTVEDTHNFIVNGVVVSNCKALDAHPHGGTPDVEAARCDVCPLWRWCRGELNRKSTGWMKLDNVINIMSTMNEDSIETQLLCLRPSTHGVVLHNFRHEHATATERSKGNYFAWTHQKDMPFYVWIDPAETKKGCALFVQIHNGRIFAFDEIVDDSGPTTEDLKEAVHKKCREGGYGEPKRVVLDPRRTDTKKIWISGTLEGIGKDHCFNAAFPNIKNGMDDIEAGLDLVRTYILNGVGERRFFINPIACPKHVEAIVNNMYKVSKDNQIHQNTKQNEKYKDEIDAIRYGIIDAHRSGGGASV